MTVIITLNSVQQQISRFKSSTEINKQIINEDNLETTKSSINPNQNTIQNIVNWRHKTIFSNRKHQLKHQF